MAIVRPFQAVRPDKEYVQKIANTEHVKGCKCEMKIVSSRPAMERTERNLSLFDKMNQIYRANGMTPLKEKTKNGGSDAAEITQAGIPCVECMGIYGGKNHSKEEFAYISSLTEAAKRLAVVATYI